MAEWVAHTKNLSIRVQNTLTIKVYYKEDKFRNNKHLLQHITLLLIYLEENLFMQKDFKIEKVTEDVFQLSPLGDEKGTIIITVPEEVLHKFKSEVNLTILENLKKKIVSI